MSNPALQKDLPLDELLNELDMVARQAEQDGPGGSDAYWVCRRRHPRYAFRRKCIVRFFGTGTDTIVALPGHSRNLSRGGVGVLVKRPFSSGEIVELEFKHVNKPAMYLAGEVRFTRYAGCGHYELGVQLRSAGPEPIFSKDPEKAMKSLDWVRNARRLEL
jgi:hypothetical protein